MNELQVIVSQTPGTIEWNFEDLKKTLRDQLATYRGMVYDDKTITTAKQDVAMLRKLRKAVEDRRLDIRKKCLEPYNLIEAQAKELVGIIDEPITLIDKQVKDYEAEQKRKRREAAVAYMKEQFAGLPEDIAQKGMARVYDSRWENATAKKKDIEAAVTAAVEDIKRSLDIVNNTEEEFREEALRVYSQNIELSAAISRVQDLQAQKQRVLEAERRRKEEAERRKAEEERRRAEAAARAEAMKNTVPPAEEPKPAPTVTQTSNPAKETVETEQRLPWDEPKTVIDVEPIPVKEEKPDDGSILLRVYGTPKEQQKILEYIAFMRVRCDKL